MRRNNRLNTEEIEKIFDGVSSDEIDFQEALNKFLEDCNIETLEGIPSNFIRMNYQPFIR